MHPDGAKHLVGHSTPSQSGMPEPSWDKVSRKHLLETITLLWALEPIAEGRRENRIPLVADTTRQLPIEREKEIATNLAFISSTRDDSTRITAVCIEEDLSGRKSTIRIASNTGSLIEVQQGFRKIADILEQASLQGS